MNSYRWNGTQWINDDSTELPLKSLKTIRFATLNILADCFPWFIEMAIRSNERYQWLCEGLEKLNPTIVGLNEVTPNALRKLQQSNFIRENYFITETSDRYFDENSSQMKVNASGLLIPHGCVILSQLPLLEVFPINVTGSHRPAVAVKIRLNDQSIYVCSHHTTAYQIPKNAEMRSNQIGDVVQLLETKNCPFVIFGDLNLHYDFEENVVIDNQLIDGWTQTHFSSQAPFNDQNLGYTFDSKRNSLIPYYIPGERRQMRLDRILFSSNFPGFAVQPCALWANEPIKSNDFLFPSDHFGLFLDVHFGEVDENLRVISLNQLDPSAQEILQRNAQNNKERRPYRLGLVRTTMAITYHVLWLGAVALGWK